MPENAATYLKEMAEQMGACGAGAGDSSTDLGEECDVYSIQNACQQLDMSTITVALSAGAVCEADEACGAAPEMEALCRSNCAQKLLGSYDACSQESLVQMLYQEQCAGTVDANGDGNIDIVDEECTDRGAGGGVCDYRGACPGPCSGPNAPGICDEGLVPDEIGAMFGDFGAPSAGPCQNGGICIDATHNTAFLPANEDTGEVLLEAGHLMCGLGLKKASPNVMGLSSVRLDIGIFCDFLHLAFSY